MRNSTLGLAVSMAVLIPNPASAMASDAAGWKKITTDQGCIAYLYDSEPLAGTSGYWRVYHWDGSCTAGQPINGTGALQTHQHNAVSGESRRELFADEGMMVDGYFQGQVQSFAYLVNDKGQWDSAGQKYALDTPLAYDRGCVVDQYRSFCEQARTGMKVATKYNKPLWQDVKGTGIAIPAPAGPPPKPADLIWTSLRSNNCALIFNHGHDGYNADYSADFSGNKILSIAPSFACSADGLAQGPVRIVTTWQLTKGKDAGAIIVDTLTANAKDGFLEGSAQNMVTGSVSYAGKPFDSQFGGGCIVAEANCDKAAGLKQRYAFLSGGKAPVSNAAVAPAIQPAFTQTESIAFSNVQNQLAADIGKSASNGANVTEAILQSLRTSFFGGSPAAFGDSATLDLALANVRQALTGNVSGDANQLLDLVMKVVRDTLASKKAAVQPQLAAALPQAAPALAPKPSAPVRPTPAVSYAALRAMPFEQRWSVRPAGRCSVIMRDSDLMWSDKGDNINGQFSRLEWSGSCNADGLANGPGTLAIYAVGSFSNGRTLFNGSLSAGMLNGPYHIEDQDDESGSWKIWSDDGGPRSYDMTFANGCNTGEYAEPCRSSDGLAMRDNFLAGLAR